MPHELNRHIESVLAENHGADLQHAAVQFYQYSLDGKVLINRISPNSRQWTVAR
jgi:hypothetical protein